MDGAISGRSEGVLSGGAAMRTETSSLKPQASGNLQIPSSKLPYQRSTATRFGVCVLNSGVSLKLEVCGFRLLACALLAASCFSSVAAPGWVTFGNNNSSRVIDSTTGNPVSV